MVYHRDATNDAVKIGGRTNAIWDRKMGFPIQSNGRERERAAGGGYVWPRSNAAAAASPERPRPSATRSLLVTVQSRELCVHEAPICP